MKLRPLAFGLTLGLFCMLFLVGAYFYPVVSESLFGQVYGAQMKALVADIYPFYGGTAWYSLYVALIFGFLDALIGGAIFALLYNWIAGAKK